MNFMIPLLEMSIGFIIGALFTWCYYLSQLKIEENDSEYWKLLCETWKKRSNNWHERYLKCSKKLKNKKAKNVPNSTGVSKIIKWQDRATLTHIQKEAVSKASRLYYQAMEELQIVVNDVLSGLKNKLPASFRITGKLGPADREVHVTYEFTGTEEELINNIQTEVVQNRNDHDHG